MVEKDDTVELEAGWSYHALLVGGGGGAVSHCTVHRYCTALYTLCCRVLAGAVGAAPGATSHFPPAASPSGWGGAGR